MPTEGSTGPQLGSGSTTSAVDGTGSTSDIATSTADATTDGSTTQAPATGSSTSVDDSSTGSTGEPMGTTTGDPGNVVYSAIPLPGGLDRIRIHKADLDADRCTWIMLVYPGFAGPYPGVTVPAEWSVESITINDVAAACASDNPGMFGGEAAIDASGTVTFGMPGAGGLYPCTVDIDASFDFQGLLPGIPPMDDMVATDIPVTGC